MSELEAALVAALADLTVVGTDRTANAGSYSYKYASIEDVVKQTRPVLQAHGLVALTPIHSQGNELACTVKIVHTSGETLDLGSLSFPHGKDAQATGSAITYHRRYALLSALGMATGEDDDGAAAVPRQASQPAWNAAQAKQHLRTLVGDDAKEAWDFGSCDGWDSYDQASVDALAKRWKERPL